MDEEEAQRAFGAAMEDDQRFDHFFKLLGLQVNYLDDRCIIEFGPKDFLFNPRGRLHGGIIAPISDCTMAHLLNHVAGPGITVEAKVQFLRSIGKARHRSEGSFLKRRRSIDFLVATITSEDGVAAVTASSTWRVLDNSSGRRS